MPSAILAHGYVCVLVVLLVQPDYAHQKIKLFDMYNDECCLTHG